MNGKLRYKPTKLGKSIGGFALRANGTLAPHSDVSIEAFLRLGWIEVASRTFSVDVVRISKFVLEVDAISEIHAKKAIQARINDDELRLDDGDQYFDLIKLEKAL